MLFPILAFVLVLGVAHPALVRAQVADPPLIINGDAKVMASDFEAFMLRVAPEHQAEFRASLERVSKAVEGVYSNRVLAQEARRLGYDKDPLVALRAKQVEEAYLAQVWQIRHQQNLVAPDMIARAREIYALNPDRFKEQQRLTLEYLQISLMGRTREMARDRARQARDKWLRGTAFEQVAAEFNDDRLFVKTKGRLENVLAKDLDPKIAEAAFSLNKPGDISEPVESASAFHILRLEKRTPSRIRPFEEVKDGLIAEQVNAFKGLETDRRIGELKNTDKTQIFEPNILDLVKPLPPVELQAVQRAGSK